MACAPKSDSFTINLLTESYEYSDGSGWFWPILYSYEVEGKGVQDIVAVSFDIPYYSDLSPCWTVSDTEAPPGTESGDAWIYPNPSAGIFHIRNTRDKGIRQSEIFDLNGHLLQRSAGSIERFDLSNYPSGIYGVTVIWEDGYRRTQKVVKLE